MFFFLLVTYPVSIIFEIAKLSENYAVERNLYGGKVICQVIF